MTFQDVYELVSRAKTAGLDQATNAVRKHGDAIAKAGKQAASASSGGFSRAVAAIRRMASAATGAVQGALGRLFGLLKGIAGLAAGAFLGAIALARNALGGLGGSAGDAKDALTDLGKRGGAALAKLKKDAKDFIKDAGGVFGAIGKVGKGFVQRAVSVAKAPIALFKSIVSGAAGAASALAGVAAAAAVAAVAVAGTFLSGVAEHSPRAAAALGRISDRLNAAKAAFFGAFGEAIAPLLEKLATTLENPAFIEFAKTWGTNIANAILWVYNLIVKKTIPNTKALIQATKNLAKALKLFFMAALKKAVELANKAWSAIKTGFLALKSALIRGLTTLLTAVKNNMTALRNAIASAWSGIKDGAVAAWSAIAGIITGAISGAQWVVSAAIDAIKSLLIGLGATLRLPFEAVGDFVEGVFEKVKGNVADGINFVIDIMNGLIKGYNDTLAKLPGASKIDMIPPVSLAKGGIASQPIWALVGDAPSPEVITPIDKLAGILRGMGIGKERGDGSGGTVVEQLHLHVTVAQGGFASPQEAARETLDGLVDAARARGWRM